MNNPVNPNGHPSRHSETPTRKTRRNSTWRASGIMLVAALVFTGAAPAANTADEVFAAPIPHGPPEPNRGDDAVPELLRDDKLVDQEGFKYRLMVDKVRISNSAVEEAKEAGHFRHYAELGFNVLSPRKYSRGDKPLREKDLERIEKASKYAGRLGMYYMQWIRGNYRSNKYDVSDGARFVDRRGNEYVAVSPNADAFWEILEAQLIPLAKISTRQPLLGAFMDFEKYSGFTEPGRGRGGFAGHMYPVSFDDAGWERFFASRGERAPGVALTERADYLDAKDLRRDFYAQQVGYWRKQCEHLRARIDEINPRFRIAVYPASYTMFVREALWPGLGTEDAPILAGEHYTYGRGNPWKDIIDWHWRIPDDQALSLDRAFLEGRKEAYEGSAPHRILGGIFPPHNMDAQLVGRKAAQFASHVDGYWVFYEGEADSRLDRRMGEWWKIANRAAKKGNEDVLVDMWEFEPQRRQYKQMFEIMKNNPVIP